MSEKPSPWGNPDLNKAADTVRAEIEAEKQKAEIAMQENIERIAAEIYDYARGSYDNRNIAIDKLLNSGQNAGSDLSRDQRDFAMKVFDTLVAKITIRYDRKNFLLSLHDHCMQIALGSVSAEPSKKTLATRIVTETKRILDAITQEERDAQK
jgi:hypothetical protein